MDVTLLVSLAALIIVLIIVCTVFLGRRSGSKKQTNTAERVEQTRAPVRRAAGQRNARRRMQATISHQIEEDNNESGNEANDEADEKPIPDFKLGAKKRAKLAAKAERKIHREVAEREREERKKREQLLQEERDKQSEKEKEEELKQEEAERRAREEKERREHEEYLKMKAAFSIEEEGYDQDDREKEENLLEEFVLYIKRNKIVVLEDLAVHFGLKTASVIDRIKELQANESLTGVIDDRGKFIYISQEELEAVAKFVRQRGRVSITELAENSNHLINLSPGKQSMVEAK